MPPATHEQAQPPVTLPGELTAALRAHPYWVVCTIAAAWLAALAVSFATPQQFEADMTIDIGRVGAVEAVEKNGALRWVTASHALENPGALAERLFGERAARGEQVPAGEMLPVVYGVRVEELGGRALSVIARAGSEQAARSFLESVGRRVLADHAQRLAEARTLQDEARAELRSRLEALRRAQDTASADETAVARRAQEVALLTALDLQWQQASGPLVTIPSSVNPIDVAEGGPVAPRTGRNLAVASIAGLFAGMAIALFLRAMRGTAA